MADATPLLRHWLLLRTLAARRQGATLRELAEAHRVTPKTILRDLTLLRQLGFHLRETAGEYGRKRWSLDDRGGLAELHFTLEEAAALYLGRQFLEPLAGTYFFDGARSAFQKIRATLGDAALRHLEKLAATFYQTTHGMSEYSSKGQLVDDLVRAIEDRQLTAMTYHSLKATEPVTHCDVHPYGLVWHRQALYLVALSPDHGEVRIFKVDRIKSVEVQRLQFTRPSDFDLASFLESSFGIFAGQGEPQTVRVRFSAAVARIVGEKLFHRSQRLTPQPDGTVLAEYRLSSLVEFQSWILSFGAQAEVLSPDSFRQATQAELARALAQYATPTERPSAHPQAVPGLG